MILTLEALAILDAIDRLGSFAAAAQELDKVPSSISYTVRKLETDLDVLLYDRRGHKAALTDAGSELLNEGRHLLRAAQELERRVQHTAAGWEPELHIALDTAIPFERLQPILADFDREVSDTTLHFSHEVLSGTWEAVWTGRADLAIGAAQDGPEQMRMTGQFRTRPLGAIEWVFAVAPQHPLAQASEPLSSEQIQQHRAIAVADTSRKLSAASAGLLTGQARLTVPTMRDKLAAQLAGLGCGHLPASLAAPYAASGQLIVKRTVDGKPANMAHVAWRGNARGKCLKWMLQRLGRPDVAPMLLGVR
ncbi:MAG TPA: LysR substrate-binding domain-containing protein [Burkholderiaceae bacterium]